MLQPKTKWVFPDPVDKKLEQELVDQLKLHPMVSRLLIQRGIENAEQANRFLHPQIEHSHDPMLLHGMKEAVSRIELALKQNEFIRIYGDYDADGVSSTVLMYTVMKKLGAHFDTYIPHRSKEGYGLNEAAIDDAKEHGVSLIITVDNGISAVEQIAYATELGIDVIVTDHHEPPEVLPQAYALVNPKLPFCSYPFSELAGVGVAFKLAQALLRTFPEELTEFVAIGTISDLMPLVDENRLLVKLGLERMKNSIYPGIRALLERTGKKTDEVTSNHIGFSLGPRINASGRISTAKHALDCLIATDEQRASECAMKLEQLNKDRQAMVETITAEALEQISEQNMQEDKVLVIASHTWNVGVVGIVASKLLEAYYRPVVVLCIDEKSGLATGSARSIPGFDIHAALSACSDVLEHFGGHQAAAGMTLKQEAISDLRHRLCEFCEESLPEDSVPETIVDLHCLAADIDLSLVEQLQSLAPYGMGNQAPRVVIGPQKIQEIKLLGKQQQHLKLLLDTGASNVGESLEALAFGKGDLQAEISPTSTMEVLGELSINEWNGRRKPQILVHDLKILQRQVFDYRGQSASQCTIKWIEQVSQYREQERAIVVYNKDHLAEIQQLLEKQERSISIWTVTASELTVTQLDDNAKGDLSQIKDVFIYSLPNQLEKLQKLLHGASAIERIHVLCTYRFASRAFPSRESFKLVYRHLLATSSWKTMMLDFLIR